MGAAQIISQVDLRRGKRSKKIQICENSHKCNTVKAKFEISGSVDYRMVSISQSEVKILPTDRTFSSHCVI